MQEGAQRNDGIYTIFDSASTDILLSVLWYESFVEKFYEAVGLEYTIFEGKASAACSNNLPDLYFLINGHWLQVRREDYVR